MLSRSRLLLAGLSLYAIVPAGPGLVAPGRSRGSEMPIRTLIVGGGPDLEHNQAAIESNVRYVQRLLPASSPVRVLFADGNPDSKTVLCEDANKRSYYRSPQINRIDGPSDAEHVRAELATVSKEAAADPQRPVLLYFTGHGSPNQRSQFTNNRYDLWGGRDLSVHTLARSLAAFPKQTPITLVMVECFSGAFGNLVFQNGDSEGELADLNVCGFFASLPNREAAGCTPEINEANYRDFTSYFFAALSGTDRLGHPLSGADYNHDGKIGMNEAFVYALIHDDSIDTPVCTSDVFLRRFVSSNDREVMSTPYRQVRSWASPSQLAGLEALSSLVGLSGEDRFARAYDHFMEINAASEDLGDVHLIRFVRLAKSVVLAHRLAGSSDEGLKARFASLVRAESGNPLR